VLAINQRTTRRRGLDLIKLLGQLSSIERGDNVILFRDFLRCYLVRLHFRKQSEMRFHTRDQSRIDAIMYRKKLILHQDYKKKLYIIVYIILYNYI